MTAHLRKKLVIIGDGSTGKTSLLRSYLASDKKLKYDPDPTILETSVVRVEVNKKLVEFIVWDTAGQEEYEKLRPITYKSSDIIFICYSVDSQESFINVTDKWIPELRYFCPTTPIILVGNKNDLRDGVKRDRLVKDEDGRLMCKRIRAHMFFECSAKSGDNVREVFESAAIIVSINSHQSDQKRAIVKKSRVRSGSANKRNKNRCFIL